MGSTKKWVGAAIIGAVAGAVGGLLLAPRAGKQTRELIKNKAKNVEKSAKDLVNKSEDAAKDVTEKTIAAAKAGSQAIKKQLNK